MQDPFTKARIFAVFDCCRVQLATMPGLAMGRGGATGEAEIFDDEEEDSCVRYFHIQACGPGGIAEADGGFAKKLLDTAIKYSAKSP